VAHLTDLHLCRDNTLEGNIPANLVEESCRRALRWGLDTAERVFITGDITDRGAPEEWDQFVAILKSLPAEERARIDWIPGNHDLSFGEDNDTTPFGFTVSRSPWGLPYERRCRVFVNNLISASSRTWRIYGKNGGVPFGEFMDRVSPYFEEYEKHPPFEKLKGGGQWYSYTLNSPDDLRSAADRYGIGLPWPSSTYPFMYQLLQEAYPIVLHEDARYVIAGLNSCAVPASSLLSGAFGALGSPQLHRLRDLANDRGERCLVLLMHHHLGWPDALRNRLKDLSKKLEMKALQLTDASDLDEVLAKLDRTVIFHGHKHVRYEARRRSTTIVCGPSVAYGDNLSRAANCVAYSVSPAGEVSVIDETYIAPP
jgi:3',5'-cyclic AMP phosphodiesterase CpdA